MNNLTKDADKLICLLYKHYLERRKDGIPKGQAKMLGSSKHLKEVLSLAEPLEDIDETLRELDRAGCLKNLYASNTIHQAILKDEVIVFMENRFKNGMLGVAEFLSKFIP